MSKFIILSLKIKLYNLIIRYLIVFLNADHVTQV
jgi:hypothetical protein